MNKTELLQHILKLKMGFQTQEIKLQIQKLQQELDDLLLEDLDTQD